MATASSVAPAFLGAPVCGSVPCASSSSPSRLLPGAAARPHYEVHPRLRGRLLDARPRGPWSGGRLSRIVGARATNDSEEQYSDEDNPFQKGLAFLAGVIGSLFSLLPRGADASSESSSPQTTLVQQLGWAPADALEDVPIYALGQMAGCTAASNLRRPDRHVTVLTTAALPWKTGPAINAMMRAIHFAKRGHTVVLLLPWIAPKDQKLVFGELFETREDQERFIWSWCAERAKVDLATLPLELRWYTANYMEAVRSVFPEGDCSEALGDGPRDVLIMEGPEHLCWYHNGQRWPSLFQHVIGVVHTDYQVYLKGMGYEGLLGADNFRDSLFFTFTSLVCSAYCDVTVKLSNTGISLPNQVCMNINGVRDEFFDIPTRSASARSGEVEIADAAVIYCVGKAALQKGWASLFKLLEAWSSDEAPLRIDAYSSGPDREAIGELAKRLCDRGEVSVELHDGADHADPKFWNYRVLVSASTAEMLCTVTAEALAAGKQVVIPAHSSNLFFKANFPDRCHFFAPEDPKSFATALRSALAPGEPRPLPDEAARLISWDAALDRLQSASEVRVLSGDLSRPSEVKSAKLAYDLHRGLQQDSPVIANWLKNQTQKSEAKSEDFAAHWRRNPEGRQVLIQVERNMKRLKLDAEKQQRRIMEWMRG